jgi:uncharacterized protein (TIGR03437 family)
VNGVAAPLYFVSPGQINAQMPWVPEFSMPPSAGVAVTTPGGAGPSFTVSQIFSAPGVYTADSSGCGQAAALNITPADGSWTPMRPTRALMLLGRCTSMRQKQHQYNYSTCSQAFFRLSRCRQNYIPGKPCSGRQV